MLWERKRGQLFFWLMDHVFHVPRGCLLPWYCRALLWVIHPWMCLLWTIEGQTYNIQYDCFVFNGVRVSRDFLEELSRGTRPGFWFRAVRHGSMLVFEQRRDDDFREGR